jgi:hypothetical protein
MATDKLTFYKGKVIPKSQIPKEELEKMEQGQTVVQGNPQQMPMSETQHLSQQDLRQQAIEYEIEKQKALRAQMQEQAYREQMIQQMQQNVPQQAMAPVKVSIFLIDNLKMDVFVDGDNFDQFTSELNEAIATNSAFAVGKKTLNASKIIYFEPNTI